MSNALGGIRFSDGTIRYYIYHGGSDTMFSAHYATKEEARDNWNGGENNECTCGREEEVEVFSSYGYGFYFTGRACKKCRSCHTAVDTMLDSTEREQANDDWWALTPPDPTSSPQ